MNEAELIKELLALIQENDCTKSNACSCGIENVFEQGVAEFATRASNVSASNMESFSLQSAASNAAIVNMTKQITGSGESS